MSSSSAAPPMMMMRQSSLSNSADMECEDAAEGCMMLDSDCSSPAPSDAVGAKVTVKYWDPQTPYMASIKQAKKQDQYSVYLKERKSFKDTPAFYMDCAHHFFHHHGKALGVRILSNILELKLDSSILLRMVAYKLDEQGEYDLSAEIFERVLSLRPDEPQSHRDLALVLEKKGEYQRAVDLLWKVISGPHWDSSFQEIEVTALYELNSLIEKAQGYVNYYKRLGGKPQKKPRTRIELPYNLDPDIWIHNIDVDLRISMAWDTDNTDMDLHVIEPTKEECYFGHKRTKIGGLCSRDFTRGYGPEEYMVRNAYPGTYVITTNYFSSSQASLTGPTTLLLGLFTNYGRPDQEVQMTTIRLSEAKDNNEIGRIDVDPTKWDRK